MQTRDFLLLALALLFVLINGWFVLAEFALVKVRGTRLKELAASGDRRAKLALSITERLDEYLSSVQLGITLVSLALGWIGEPAIAHLLGALLSGIISSPTVIHGIAVTIAFLTITFLHVVIGEQAPKTLAIQGAERFALATAVPLHLFFLLTYPLMRILQKSSNGVVRILGFQPATEGEGAHSEEELRMIVAASHRHGVLDEATRDLLDNVFEYTERVAREIMTPRRDVVALTTDVAVDDSIAKAIDKEYTRYPLIDPDSDRVLGFVHIKDLMAIATGRRRVTSLMEIARQPVFVPETVSIDRVRRQLQAKRTHFGVVVDEFGDFTGIVTLEDLLEELVGEIQDELDVELPKIVRRPDGTAEVDASLLLDAAAKKLKLQLDDDVEGVDTLGGYVFTVLGRAPVPGDSIVVGEHRLEVLHVDELRIRRLRVVKLPTDGSEDGRSPPSPAEIRH